MGAQGVADKAGQVSEAYLRPKDTVPEMQRRSATALRLARAWGGQATPGVTPGSPPGVTPPTAVGPAIGAPGGPNITPGMTDQAWLDEMAKRYPTMAGPNDTSQRPNATPTTIPPAIRQAAATLLAMPEAEAAVAYGPMVKELQSRGEAMQAPPNYPGHAAVQAMAGDGGTAPYQVASNAPVPPPLPPNQMAPGGERGPPAPTPAPAPTAAPAQTGGLPRMADVPSGINRPEVRQAQQLLQRATQIELLASQTPKDLATQQAAKAAADNLRLRAQTLLQTDSVVQTQEGQFHPMTGALDKPVANYHETSPGSGIWVGGPGTEPRFQPPGRLVVGPDGTVYQTGVGGATVLEPSKPAAIAARKAAEAQGTETGKDVAKQLPALAAQGREATQAIGNIDYGMSQLAKASQGGINTGYFSGALTEVQSALKSLGLPTDKIPFINVDPSAIGNIQTAQKNSRHRFIGDPETGTRRFADHRRQDPAFHSRATRHRDRSAGTRPSAELGAFAIRLRGRDVPRGDGRGRHQPDRHAAAELAGTLLPGQGVRADLRSGDRRDAATRGTGTGPRGAAGSADDSAGQPDRAHAEHGLPDAEGSVEVDRHRLGSPLTWRNCPMPRCSVRPRHPPMPRRR